MRQRPMACGRFTIAALSGHLSAYQVLVAHGAALTVQDNDGWSALHYAAQGGHPDILAALAVVRS